MKDIAAIKIKEKNYMNAVRELLNDLNVSQHIKDRNKIILKPNLVNTDPPPTTTDVNLIEALVLYFLKHSKASEIIVAEGSGGVETFDAFKKLGYTRLAKKHPIKLVDLDQEEVIWKEEPDAEVHKKFPLPEILNSGFLVSVPVLKVHTMTRVTLGLKNMIGCAPQKYFQGTFNKSKTHKSLERGIVDINMYCKTDFTIIDGAVGQKDSHLNGTPCSPPKNILIAGSDLQAVEKEGCKYLDVDYRNVKHILLAGEKLN